MREYRVQKALNAFVVLNADGERVSPFWANEIAAERERARMQDAYDARVKRGMRPCLRCGQSFFSEGIHNRLCGGCKSHANGLGAEMTG